MNELIQFDLKLQKILKVYYTLLDYFLKKVLKKNKLNGQLFLIHFDKIYGPTLAGNKKDTKLFEKLNEIGINIKDLKMQEDFFKLNDKFNEKIIKIIDVSKEKKDSKIELILRYKKECALFRYFQITSESENRGEKEMFMLVLITKDPNVEHKLNSAKNQIKDVLSRYFLLFEKDFVISEILSNKINKLSSWNLIDNYFFSNKIFVKDMIPKIDKLRIELNDLVGKSFGNEDLEKIKKEGYEKIRKTAVGEV